LYLSIYKFNQIKVYYIFRICSFASALGTSWGVT